MNEFAPVMTTACIGLVLVLGIELSAWRGLKAAQRPEAIARMVVWGGLLCLLLALTAAGSAAPH